MLHRPILSGRLGKWAYGLIEYDLDYESLKSTKGQIIDDFIVEHRVSIEHDLDVNLIFLTPWKLYFDGSACNDGQGIGIVFISPSGACFEMSSRLEYFCTYNQTEYEAFLFGLEILESMDVKHVEAFGDSLLIVHQISGKYQCLHGSLNAYLDKSLDVTARFDEFSIHHIYWHENSRANDLAPQASGYNVSSKNFSITKKLMCARVQNLESLSVLNVETSLTDSSTGLTGSSGTLTGLTGPVIPNNSDNSKQDKADVVDCRKPIIDYLQDPSWKVDRKVRWLAFKFTLVDGDLYRRTANDLLLKCLDSDQAKVAMGEVHEGICGTHQLTPKMKWLLWRGGFYCPTMIVDCFRNYKGCEECQMFDNIQLAPAAMMHHIIKPWPFGGWRLDFIGQIHHPPSKGHHFVLVAIDYFTKWTEVVPIKNMTHKEVIEFITEHIIHRFGIPQTLMTDQDTSFVSGQVREFIESYKIKLLNSSPYYAQANGQAELSKNILIKHIKKKIEDNPRRWHEVLSEALWAHHIFRHGATKVTPFELIYGQEVILPVEVNLAAYMLAK
jgi:ribonuclease HI